MDDDGGSGVPEWVVTYGDMMSLLLTFFIMLVSLSELKAEEKFQVLLESIRESFGYSTGQAGAPGKSFQSARTSFQPMAGKKGRAQESGGATEAAPQGPHIKVQRFREGTVNTIGGAVYFEPFQATIEEEAKANLDAIAEGLAGKRNKVEVRGHTARVPLPAGSPYRSKTELAFARSLAVMDYLLEKGIEVERIRLSQAGDSEPVIRARDETNRRFNRRVEVFMLDVFSEELMPDVPQ